MEFEHMLETIKRFIYNKTSTASCIDEKLKLISKYLK